MSLRYQPLSLGILYWLIVNMTLFFSPVTVATKAFLNLRYIRDQSFGRLSPATPFEDVPCTDRGGAQPCPCGGYSQDFKWGLSSFISLILGCSKVEKYAAIRTCSRWPSVTRREALALLFAGAAAGDRWQCKAKCRNIISACFHLICFLSHISVCGSRGRGRRVRRGGRGWEFPSCFSSGAECEGNNSWSDSRHSLGQGLFEERGQARDSHRYHCQWHCQGYLWETRDRRGEQYALS